MSQFTLNGHPVPFHPSPNHSARPAGTRPSVIVLHSTGGSFAGAQHWLCQPASRVSAHFLIARDGRVVQLVPLTRAAWHAGVSRWQGRPGVNARSIGIELEHLDGKQDWPAAQLRAAADLTRALMTRYNIPAAAITGHAHIAQPPGRKVDPQHFPWATFRTLLT